MKNLCYLGCISCDLILNFPSICVALMGHSSYGIGVHIRDWFAVFGRNNLSEKAVKNELLSFHQTAFKGEPYA